MAAPATINVVSARFTPHIRALIREMAPAGDDLALATLILGAIDPSHIGRLRRADVDLLGQQAAARGLFRELTGACCG